MTTKEEKTAPALAFKMERDYTGRTYVEVIFKCPSCGELHRKRETYLPIPARFREVGSVAACGNYVRVLMPWAEENGW